MKKSIALPIIVLIFAAAIVGGAFWWYSNNQDIFSPVNVNTKPVSQITAVAATISYQQGDVQVREGEASWRTVVTDTVLHQGDSVKTGEDSKAIIELENGDIFRLGYNTEVFLTSLNSDEIAITQVNGASYHRVTKNTSKLYLVKAEEVTVQSVGTAFDVVETDTTVDVTVIESEVKVKTGEEEESVIEGKTAKYDKDDKDVSVDDLEKENLTNDWYTWNKEEDSKNDNKLGVLDDYAGPKLVVTNPENELTVTRSTVDITGTVDDLNAKITINGEEVNNNAGQFSRAVTLSAGKNIFTIIAENTDEYRTIKELKIIYQVAASATPLTLKAESQDEGVQLEWNESKNSTFEFYKVVRSETNADLMYPDDGYIVKRDEGQESYLDTDVSADKTYYYRVCEVMSGEIVFCSNVVHMRGKKVEQEVPDQDDTGDSDSSSSDNFVGMTLEGEAEDDGIKLEWSVAGINIEHGFKIAKGETINPVYPGNDYKYISDSSTRGYTWPITDGGTYHFRVCQYNGDGKCLVYSNDVVVTAKKPADGEVNLVMSAKAEDSGVGLWWTDVSEQVAGFKYYKVVRSESNSDLRYPDDGHIAVKDDDSTSHRDYSAIKGTSYYYRICAVGNSISCSNVIQITAIHDNTAPDAVTLSASYSGEGLALTWTASAEKDFAYYKIVWSQTNSSPKYPDDGYIKAVSSANDTSYSDEGSENRDSAVDLSTGIHYYSVCVVDQASQVTCSNVVTISDGVVQ